MVNPLQTHPPLHAGCRSLALEHPTISQALDQLTSEFTCPVPMDPSPFSGLSYRFLAGASHSSPGAHCSPSARDRSSISEGGIPCYSFVRLSSSTSPIPLHLLAVFLCLLYRPLHQIMRRPLLPLPWTVMITNRSLTGPHSRVRPRLLGDRLIKRTRNPSPVTASAPTTILR